MEESTLENPLTTTGTTSTNITDDTDGVFVAARTAGALPGATIALDDRNLDMGRAALRYFNTSYQPNTGFYNSSFNYAFTSVWGIASSIAALASAEQLSLIHTSVFDQRMALLLETLNQIPLYNNELPNREYSTQTGQMIGTDGRPSSVGKGWSAIDVGRLLIWLKIVETWYPTHANAVNTVVSRFNFDRLAQNNQLNAVYFDGTTEEYFQEGRFGYEQYAALGFYLWGIEVEAALDREDTATTQIYDLEIPFDTRDNAFLTSDPFILMALELGSPSEEWMATIRNVYLVQRERGLRAGIPTAVSEDNLDQAPWIGFATILHEGENWKTYDFQGNQLRQQDYQLSFKAATGWHALFDDDYTEYLVTFMNDRSDPRLGYYTGIYSDGRVNKSINVNTNAVILESLLYISRLKNAFVDLRQAVPQELDINPTLKSRSAEFVRR